jgi:predicted nucleic acid-binding protein
MNYIIDNCSLVNLVNCNLLAHCINGLSHSFFITPIVCDKECTSECKIQVDALIASGHLSKLPFIPNVAEFIRLANDFSIDDGECESILACQSYNFALVSDDKAARRCAENLLGEKNRTGSLGLIKQLVAAGSIACAEAIKAYHEIRNTGGFIPRINPKQELC